MKADFKGYHIHFTKCAGKSIRQVVRKYENLHTVLFLGEQPKLHRDIGGLTSEYYGDISKEDWKQTFKFAIVRNPFDRLVSAMKAWQGKGCRYGMRDIVGVAEKCAAIGWDKIKEIDIVEKTQVDAQGWWKREEALMTHLVPYTEFPLEDIEFFGRFEYLQDEWERICVILGINEDLPHNNRSKHLAYDYYFNGDLVSRVEKVYGRDLEKFGYKFN